MGIPTNTKDAWIMDAMDGKWQYMLKKGATELQSS